MIEEGNIDLTQETGQKRVVGGKAVQLAFRQGRGANGGGSVVIQRGGAWAVDCTLLLLQAVGGRTRSMEDRFIAESGTDVTEAIGLYPRPLQSSRIPDTIRLRAPALHGQPRT